MQVFSLGQGLHFFVVLVFRVERKNNKLAASSEFIYKQKLKSTIFRAELFGTLRCMVAIGFLAENRTKSFLFLSNQASDRCFFST